MRCNMEKKLKINFIFKGIAVFAFVAFCLLAILAGVTLPFVSNASTVDCAVASAESDYATASSTTAIDLESFTIPISQCNGTDIYYGFYITETFYNYISNFDFSGDYDSGLLCFQTNSNRIYAMNTFTDIENTVVKFFGYTYSYDTNAHYIFTNDFTYSQSDKVFIDTNGFTFLVDDSGNIFSGFFANVPQEFKNYLRVFNQLPFGGDTTELENQIATLTSEKNVLQAQLTEKQNQIDTLTAEKNALQTQVNNLTSDKSALQAQLTEKQNQIDILTAEKNALQSQLDSISFSSRFGFVSNFSSSSLYANLNVFPVIPDNLTTIKDSSGNYINGWYNSGDTFYLSIVTAYISPNEIRRPSICGWSLVPRSDDSNFDLYFSLLGNTIYYCGIAQIVDNSVNIIDSTHKQVLVDSNFDPNVYMVSSSLYYFKLNSSFTRDQVNSFFALVDLDNFSPSDNQYYFAGFNAASKGYFDDGYNQGYSVGKDEGYNTGFSAGDAKGYSRGLESANNYSFLSLFGAIFDAPIKAIFGGTSTLPAGTTITDSNGNTITLQSTTTVNRAGFLNFNLLGVNLSGFVLALFSLSILVVVIKFALAKGR